MNVKFCISIAEGELRKISNTLIRGEEYRAQTCLSYAGEPIPGLHLSPVLFTDWEFFLEDGPPGKVMIKELLKKECPWLNNIGTPTLPQFKDIINFEKEHRHTLCH